MQICDNLSVSAAPSQLPWEGSLGISCFPDGDGDLGDEFFGVVRQAVVDQGDLAGEAVRLQVVCADVVHQTAVALRRLQVAAVGDAQRLPQPEQAAGAAVHTLDHVELRRLCLAQLAQAVVDLALDARELLLPPGDLLLLLAKLLLDAAHVAVLQKVRDLRQGQIQRAQMENSEPAAFASPIGSSVCGNSRDVRYAPGMRTQTIDRKLCRNDSPDRPQAQK